MARSDITELLDNHDASGVAATIGTGDVSAGEVLDVSLARMEERDPALNAIVDTCPEAARASLAQLDPTAPFAGVPFVVKDLGATVAGLRATNGSRLWADHVAAEDSELVRRYRAAGFVIIGTTNTPELGKSASTESVLHGAAHNPHRLTHSPGGSSGGTAAAVAAGIVGIGHGSDGGGSIRIPASGCGLVGLKPSRGRTPAGPSYTLMTRPLGVHHVLTRSVRDTARVLDATAGPTSGDAYVIDRPTESWAMAASRPPKRLRIAMDTADRFGTEIHSECAEVVQRSARLLEDLGHEVTEARPDYPNDSFTVVMSVISGVATRIEIDDRIAQLGRELSEDDIEPFTRFIYDLGQSATGDQVLRAFRQLEHAARQIGMFFDDYDVLLTATLAQPVPELGLLDPMSVEAMIERSSTYSVLTSPFNITGNPGISLPLGTDSSGLPVGVQLVAAFGREDLLLSLAGQVEDAAPWPITPVWPPTA